MPPPRTTVVNHRFDAFDIYIGRGSVWGNPFTHLPLDRTQAKYHVATREISIAKYREWIQTQPHLMRLLPRLKGKRLGCTCRPLTCHGDVLAELADALPEAA